tara:strand:- start:139 stop:708 length:570 start_codon:yes stop_codon:yes gene_type:complete
MSSILKVDQLQDSGGNSIISSNGSGTFTSSLPNTGITMADMWRLTSDLSFTGNTETAITANLEQVNTTGFGRIGTGMTESSGIFTFPSTGIYQVTSCGQFYGGLDIPYVRLQIKTTTDNSTYNLTTAQNSHTHNGYYILNQNETFFDVTNTSTHKVKFEIRHNSDGSITGTSSSTYIATVFKFIRLGDT